MPYRPHQEREAGQQQALESAHPLPSVPRSASGQSAPRHDRVGLERRDHPSRLAGSGLGGRVGLVGARWRIETGASASVPWGWPPRADEIGQRGMAGLGEARGGEARRGWAWRGQAGRGEARNRNRGLAPVPWGWPSRPGEIGQQGMARHGAARRGRARGGWAWHGMAGRG